MRLCSRNLPTTEVTVIFSVLPGTPGTMQQIPRMIRSMRTPAQLASLSLSISWRSVTEFALMRIRPSAPRAICSSIISMIRFFIANGATSSLSYSPPLLPISMFSKKLTASRVMSDLAVIMQKSVYSVEVFSL